MKRIQLRHTVAVALGLLAAALVTLSPVGGVQGETPAAGDHWNVYTDRRADRILSIFWGRHVGQIANLSHTPRPIEKIRADPFVEGIAEIIARQVSQLPHGVYDARSDRTFVVFPGCSPLGGTDTTPCTADPYITYYHHKSNTWATPMKVADSPPRHDSHFYPQIIIDSQNYVHVFNSGHLDPIQHFQSTVKTDHGSILSPANWQERPFSNTDDQDKATYVMAFKTQSDAIYLFYRQTTQDAPDYYEPIYYLKSTDDGDTWSMPRKAIDPGGKNQSDGSCDDLTNDDEWDTIYIKGISHQSDPEGLHITFENHKNHNDYQDKLFYVYFDFGDERVYAPNGNDLGQCVNQSEFENPANRTEIHSTGQREFSNKTCSVVGIDANGQVNVFHTTRENNGKLTINQVVWNGSDWDPAIHLFWDDPYDTRPLDVEFYDDNSFDLYIEQAKFDSSLIKLSRWRYNNNPNDPQWSRTMIKSNTKDAIYSFAFVTNHHPHIKMTFIEGPYTDWRYPLPTGKMYAWGIREDVRLYSMSGQVADVSSVPFSGVTISADAGMTATTDASGHYTLTGVTMGTYALAPTLTGYTFHPLTRTVTLPPDGTDEDFIILSGPVSTTLTLGPDTVSLPASLTYTDTQGYTVRLDCPPGVVSRPTELVLQPTVASGGTGLALAGHAFDLAAYQQGTAQPNLTFDVPLAVTIHYSDDGLHLVSDESELSLRRWTGDEWQDAAETCHPSSYVRDLENNVLSAGLCHSGSFGLFGPTNQIFLPLVFSGYDSNRLTHHPSDDVQPALSPDGKTVVFVSHRDGQPDLYRTSAIGRPAANLNPTLADKDTPIFSPHGSTIAFATNQAGDWDIYLVDADGSNPRVAVEGPGTDELHPSFTPDGTGLVFSSNRADGNWDIYSAAIGSSTWTRLTADPAADRFPTLSANGGTAGTRAIAFRSERDGNSEIYLMDADGSNLRRVTDDPAFDGYPSITPDGSGVVFASDRSGQWNAYVVNLAGEGLRALGQREGWQMDTPRLSKDGRLILYAGGQVGDTFDIYSRPFASPLVLIGQRGADNLGDHCDWEAGVLAYGWIHAWQATQDDQYRQWAQQWVDACLPLKTEITEAKHVNDGLLGYAALVAYETSGQPEYLAFAEQVADYLMNTAPRTADGTLAHDSNRVWVDTLLGAVPFLIKMSQVFGGDVYADEAISQLIQHAAHLQDPGSGLYHHAWDESGNDPPSAGSGHGAGQVYWGRGNGWALLADAEVLSAITTTHPLRSAVLDIMQKQAAALRPLQDAGGLWHTVLTRPDFYLETSGSALIGYALKRGVQEGWLDREVYLPIAQAAVLGVWRQVLADGTVTNVSAPTWPMLTEEEYNARPYGSLQLYGQGVALLVESP